MKCYYEINIFLQHLVTRYGYDDIVTLLLNRTRIHFLASMNPDGFEKSIENSCKGERGRYNRSFQFHHSFEFFWISSLWLGRTIKVLTWTGIFRITSRRTTPPSSRRRGRSSAGCPPSLSFSPPVFTVALSSLLIHMKITSTSVI